MYSPEQSTPPAQVEEEGIILKKEVLDYSTAREDQESYDLSFQQEYEYDVYLDDLHGGWDKGEPLKLALGGNFGITYDWEKNQSQSQPYEEVVAEGEGVVGLNPIVLEQGVVQATVKQEDLKMIPTSATQPQYQQDYHHDFTQQEDHQAPAITTQPYNLITYELSFTDYEYDMYLKDLNNWDKDDTMKLTQLVSVHGFEWDKVAQSFEDPAKTPENCESRYGCLIQFLRRKNPQFFQFNPAPTTTGVPDTAATAGPSPSTYNVPSLSSSLGSFIASKKRKSDVLTASKVKPNDAYLSESEAAKKKRSRRTASEIERNYKCTIPNCLKAYGSEGALKMHMKLKHPLVKAAVSKPTNPPVTNGGRTWGNNWTSSY